MGIESYFEEERLPFEMGYLPETFQKKAESELRETPENIEKGLKLMREMALRFSENDAAKGDQKKEKNEFDEDFLVQYLRCRKYDVPRAFSQLKNFVILRRKNPEAFKNIKFESLQVTTRKKIATFLPYRCRDGCAILLVQLDNWKPEEFPLEDVKRMVIVMLLQALRDPMTQVNGFKVIFNVKSNPLRHLRYITPHNLYLLYHATQQCVPGRFKGIHIVNNSFTFKAAWILLKPFLSEKFRKRFHFHTSVDTLLNFFPAYSLPVDYAGEITEFDMTDWLKKVTEEDKLATLGGGTSKESSAEKGKSDSADGTDNSVSVDNQ